MNRHAEAYGYAQGALRSLLGREPTRREIAYLMAVGRLETGYGYGWKGAGKGSFNVGAIQAGSWKGATFSCYDSRPNPDGTSTVYEARFRKYATPVDGWRDFAKVMFVNRGRSVVLDAAQRDDSLGVSRALHATGYYEGHGKTVADRIANHHKALTKALAAAAPHLPPEDCP